MVIIQPFNKRFSKIIVENSHLLLQRKLEPQAIIKYGLSNQNYLLVAIEEKKTVGFILGYSKLGKLSILTIFVEPEFRNKKIGTLLLSSLIHQDKKMWNVRLRSMDFNLIDFFKKNNFFVIEELNLYKKSEIEFDRPRGNNHIEIYQVKDYEIIDEIIRIEKHSFQSYWHKSKEEWKTILDNINEVVFIAQFNIEGVPKIVGYNHNSINRDKNSIEGQYIRVAVDPEFRRSGIATALTHEAFKYFKHNHVESIYLSTIAGNKNLNEMYQRWQFKQFDQDIILGYTPDKKEN